MNDQWWRGSVTYQVYPRSFQDTSGDGIGDIPGVARRLDYIASLGVDAIWLSPVFTSPMDDMGYDVSNYTDIDPLFGTLADFDRMVARAHELGLKVIIDQVLSHTSDRHPWFTESRASKDNPKADWYVWSDPLPDGAPPNNWISNFGGPAWTWDSRRRQYYMHNFLSTQPDLNFHQPAVQDALLEVVRFWLERGVDGFRLDTVNYYFHDEELRSNPPHPMGEPHVNPYRMQDHLYSKTQPENIAFLQRLRALLDEYDDRTTIGEVGEGHRSGAVMAEYTRGNDRLHMAYSFQMLDDAFTARHFHDEIAAFFDMAPDGWPCWSFSNHDVIRHVSRWQGHASDRGILVRQSAAMLLSFPGSVCLYQGEELGLPEANIEFEELTDPPGITFWPDYKGRDGCRTPMPWDGENDHSGFSTAKPWLPIKPAHAALHVAGQEEDPNSSLEFYRQMLRFRHQRRELREGATRFYDTPEPVLAFARVAPRSASVCVFNLSTATVALSASGVALSNEAPSHSAGLIDDVLTLGANGFVFLDTPNGVDRAEIAMAA